MMIKFFGSQLNLLQMSFSGAIFILVIIVIRAIAINKLPKKTFLVLWGIALLRLLLPFSVSSVFSIYSLVNKRMPVRNSLVEAPAANLVPAVPAGQNIVGGAAAWTMQRDMPVSEIPAASLSGWIIVWCIGAVLCAAFFILSYLRCRMEFRASLPVENDFVMQWTKEHQLRRFVTIRQSDRISAPLTYGIFCPVILMPKTTDWKNERQLQYVLLHEFVHIRRYDSAIKLIMTFALCIHWFNPMVWAMYVLFNRDIEMACDESVVRQFGEQAKSVYALTLISMEEKKSSLMPLCNNFSKTAIEERITAIMKIKKRSLFAIVTAIILVFGVTAVFVTSAAAEKDEISAMSGTNFSEEEYEKLLALRFDGYEDMTVSEYQEKVWELTDTDSYRNLLERFSKDEELYAMKDSNEIASFLFYTLEPLTAERWQIRDFEGSIASDFPDSSDNALLEYVLTFLIVNADTLTVREYNDARLGFVQDLQVFLQNKTADELQNEDAMREAIDVEIDRLAEQWGTEALYIDVEYFFRPLTNLSGTEEQWEKENWTEEQWEKENWTEEQWAEEEKEIEAQSLKERQAQWDATLAPYLSFGLTYYYDSSDDDYKMYYQGKQVRGIVDEVEGIWISAHSGISTYEEDAVELYAVYEDSRLIGLREATEQEQEGWSKLREESTAEYMESLETQGPRIYPNGTEADYQSLLALKKKDYQKMSVAEFNDILLEWANENWECSERIREDIGRNDYQVALSGEELSFIELTMMLSNTENFCMIESINTGVAEEKPWYGGIRYDKSSDDGLAWCSLWYQISYHILDKERLTVGERDRCISGFIKEVQNFWEETALEQLLAMTESDIVSRFQQFVSAHSNALIEISIDEDQVQFESMDERAVRYDWQN